MNDWSPAARKLIRVGREAPGLGREGREASRARVVARVAAAAAVASQGVSSAAASGAAHGAAAGAGAASGSGVAGVIAAGGLRAVATKLVIGATLVGASAATSHWLARPHGTTVVAASASRPAGPAAPSAATALPGAPAVRDDVPVTADAVLSATPGLAATPATLNAPHAGALGHAGSAPMGRAHEATWGGPSREPLAAVASAPAPSDSSFVADVQLLRGVWRGLQAGDAAGALRSLDERRAAGNEGAFSEEREAARVVTLCQLGRRDEARAEATRFLRAHPQSPLAARVTGACPDAAP